MVVRVGGSGGREGGIYLHTYHSWMGGGGSKKQNIGCVLVVKATKRFVYIMRNVVVAVETLDNFRALLLTDSKPYVCV